MKTKDIELDEAVFTHGKLWDRLDDVGAIRESMHDIELRKNYPGDGEDIGFRNYSLLVRGFYAGSVVEDVELGLWEAHFTNGALNIDTINDKKSVKKLMKAILRELDFAY